MDYRKTAQEIYDHIGKKENIISAAHCATRLRLVISDNSKADKEYVENIEGVKGVFFAQGQMQIILGTGVVNKVYDEFIRIAGVSESSKEELKKVAASRANPVQRLIKTLGDIFVPIIPAIVASGFLMGIMEAPYRDIVFDGKTVPYPAAFYPHTLTCLSFSKTLSLPGERLGYVAVNPACEGADILVDNSGPDLPLYGPQLPAQHHPESRQPLPGCHQRPLRLRDQQEPVVRQTHRAGL